MELLRELFFDNGTQKEVCFRFGTAMPTYYRLVADYRLYGLWAVIPAPSPGKQSPSAELQLAIILDKLKHPKWSPEAIIKTHKLNVSRFTVHRVIKRWGLEDKHRNPVALDEYLGKETPVTEEPFQPLQSAYHLQSEKTILSTRRINRHFDLIGNKMRLRPFQLCDPGPFILAPFVNELGVVQAFDTYGPIKLRGKEISNLPLLNVFRILAGYRRISHLTNNRDRSVALASGVAMFGSTSKYNKDTIAFEFSHLHQLRCDLVARARELGQIIKLIQPALDNNQGWQRYNQDDEFKAIEVDLPKTGLAMKIVILRDRQKKEKNIRCFGTTNVQLPAKDILRKYRFRWIIENGIKDLVASYFVDEVFGLDPAKVEFEFYCVMVARLAYEYFLKELAGKYYNKVDGNKYTLQKMRNILFEKRNCTIEQDHSGNLILTLLDWQHKGTVEDHVAKMLLSLSEKGKNKVLWWNNRGIFLRATNQYEM